jgi:hypothetical protein
MAPFIAKRLFGWEQTSIMVNNTKLIIPSRTDSIYCRDCDFIFCDWRFDDEEMARLYQDYRGKEYAMQRDFYEPGYALINDKLGKMKDELDTRRDSMEEFLVKNLDCSEISTVLDYGGDEGQFIPDCLAQADKYVFEISGRAASPDVTLITDESKCGFYDLVMCCHVLEHCSYPREVLRRITGYAARYIYIELPLERTRDSGHEYAKIYHEHINLFNEASLRKLLEVDGLHVIDFRTQEISTALGTGRVLMALCSVATASAGQKNAANN